MGRLQAAWDEMVTEGPQLLCRKLFHQFLGSRVASAALCGAGAWCHQGCLFPSLLFTGSLLQPKELCK